ncbi:DUF7344 domain-containing protein [Natranaeroarchaeum sulfidigenes]
MSGDDLSGRRCESDRIAEQPVSIDEVLQRHGITPFLDAPAELHTILSSPFRKCVLIELAQADGPLTPEELARRVVEYEEVEVTTRSKALVRLHHIHLPKLRSCGAVKKNNYSNDYVIEVV